MDSYSDRPNILWITSEDNGPHLGSYGDANAVTPHLDALATGGTIYLNAWSTLPVCAPARTAIITGMYPSSIGAEHMRSMALLPPGIRLFPEYLRDAGYYCTNNNKEDYNVPSNDEVWDESSRQAHWKNRKLGQPFFAVFNIGTTHESQIRRRPHTPVHDPAAVQLPAHYPDTPESRGDWAQYYDKMTEMDRAVGQRLRELEEAGLADDTIVMYYGDHGIGLPRSKRSPYNSGLRVPLIVVVPEKYRDLAPSDVGVGNMSDRLVSFVDLAPTLLRLADLEAPDNMQGKPFLGAKDLPEKEYLFGFRGRMDERYEMIRVIRDKRFLYMKNYMPHLAHGQHVAYMFQTPSTRAWYDKFVEGTLSPEHAYFWERKAPEELYDLEADPDEVRNLAGIPEHLERLRRMRGALEQILEDTRDVGFVPEPDYYTVYRDRILNELAQDEEAYPLALIRKVAGMATGLRFDPSLVGYLSHRNSNVRYWAATGVLNHEGSIEGMPIVQLRGLLDDVSPSVQIVAAELLARHGSGEDSRSALSILLELSDITKQHVTVVTFALNALDYLDEYAAPIKSEIAALPKTSETLPNRNRNYVSDLIAKIEADLR
ncbi:MAG: sulfatase-like hydrolase/transferase [Candidatus Hydrogenedentota bacterium]